MEALVLGYTRQEFFSLRVKHLGRKIDACRATGDFCLNRLNTFHLENYVEYDRKRVALAESLSFASLVAVHLILCQSLFSE